MRLYSYWRSSTSYRVRIALNLKGLAYKTATVDLLGGAQKDPAYTALNPVAGVPTLVLDDGTVLTQSMAILEWLEAMHPDPALLSTDRVTAAHVRAAAMVVACDIHPVNNLKVGGKLIQMGHIQKEVKAWMSDWMAQGLDAFEALIPNGTEFCFSDAPSLADLCLVPQLYNARRWGLDLSAHQRLTDIEARCLALPAFVAAAPENQPDATT